MRRIWQLPSPSFFSYESLYPFDCFLFLLYHIGGGEEELSCKGPLEELELDESELPSVVEPELVEFGLLLLLFTFFFSVGRPRSCLFTHLSLVYSSSSCLSQDACLSGNPPFLEFLLDLFSLAAYQTDLQDSQGKPFFSLRELCAPFSTILSFFASFSSILS